MPTEISLPSTVYPGVGYVLLQVGEPIMGDAEMRRFGTNRWSSAPYSTNPGRAHMMRNFNPHRRPRTHAEVTATMPGLDLPTLPVGWAYVVPGERVPREARYFRAGSATHPSPPCFMGESWPTACNGIRFDPDESEHWRYAAPLGAGASPAAPAPEPPLVITSTRPPRGVRRASVVPLNLP